MQHNVELPQVELNMESVELLRWLVDVGDRVESEQSILEVETQKATVEVPSPVAGFIRRQLVQAGDTIGEKAMLCIVTDTADEAFGDAVEVGVESGKGITDGPCGPSTAHSVARFEDNVDAQQADRRLRATPLARKLAHDLGVDIHRVRGTGPMGRIKHADVQAFAAQPGPVTASTTAPIIADWTKLSPTRLALIEQMKRALAEIPQINLTRQFDVTPLLTRTAGITFTHRLIVASARALAKHPALHTMIQGDSIRTEPVAVAVAMDTPYGLLAPVIRAADNLSLPQVVEALTVLIQRAQANALRREDLADGPFALTNLGMFEIDAFDPLVFHGQTAVLAAGRAVEVAAGRRVAWLTLAVDHRVVDGAEAARFLKTLQEEILCL